MSEWFFWPPQVRGKMIKIEEKNLRSDGISHFIKSLRLGKSEQAMAIAELLLKKKLITKDYLMRRMVIFLYEDWSLEMIKATSGVLSDYNATKQKNLKTSDGLRVNYDSGEGDMNAFRRLIYLLSILPKRRETEDWVGRLKSLDEAIIIRKQREKQKYIEMPSYSLDVHSKTGKAMKEKGIELDERYSWNEYGNYFMEAEYERFWELNPDRIEQEINELEEIVKRNHNLF